MFESVPECFVAVFAAGIEVSAEGTLDDGGVLRNDGEVGAKVIETEAGGVDFVDGDVPGGGFNQTEPGVRASAMWSVC